MKGIDIGSYWKWKFTENPQLNKTLSLKRSTQVQFFLYCSCIALIRTPAIQCCNTSFLQLAETWRLLAAVVQKPVLQLYCACADCCNTTKFLRYVIVCSCIVVVLHLCGPLNSVGVGWLMVMCVLCVVIIWMRCLAICFCHATCLRRQSKASSRISSTLTQPFSTVNNSVSILSDCLYTLSQKRVHFVFAHNFNMCPPIFVIFGARIPQETWNEGYVINPP